MTASSNAFASPVKGKRGMGLLCDRAHHKRGACLVANPSRGPGRIYKERGSRAGMDAVLAAYAFVCRSSFASHNQCRGEGMSQVAADHRS